MTGTEGDIMTGTEGDIMTGTEGDIMTGTEGDIMTGTEGDIMTGTEGDIMTGYRVRSQGKKRDRGQITRSRQLTSIRASLLYNVGKPQQS